MARDLLLFLLLKSQYSANFSQTKQIHKNKSSLHKDTSIDQNDKEKPEL
jgi:hypothetical protein